MGSVWRAEHIELRTPAAIKLIDPAIGESAEALARFKREAQAAASLRSANVVQILDYGVDEGVPYIAMELLEGESLAGRLERLKRLDPRHTAWILSQVGKAIGRAHELGITHRDLKPDNVFIARDVGDEVVKVLDFGIAKSRPLSADESAQMTRTGTMMGTPYYMSPEQTSGRRSVDHRADIWALGVIAFQCLVGQRPFEAETLGGLTLAICVEPIPRPSSVAPVPAGFDQWFERAVCRDPDARFQTMSEAIAELSAVCGFLHERGAIGSAAGLAPPPSGSDRSSLAGLPEHAQTVAAAQSAPDANSTGAPAAVTMSKARRSARPLVVVALGVASAMVVVGIILLRGVGGGLSEEQPPAAASAVPASPGLHAPGSASAPAPSQPEPAKPSPDTAAAEPVDERRDSAISTAAADAPTKSAPSPVRRPAKITTKPPEPAPQAAATPTAKAAATSKPVSAEERLGF
jgi:serine/threonine-protein kinase